MLKALRTKLKRNSGSSLAEMLVAILIMLMVTSVVVVGVQMASRQYRNSMIISEEKILASTLASVVESELANTKEVSLDASNNLRSFIPKTYGIKKAACSFYSVTKSEDDELYPAAEGELFLGTENVNGTMTGHLLISSASYSKYKLKARITVKYINNAFHVVLTVKDSSGIETSTTFDVLPLNELSITYI